MKNLEINIGKACNNKCKFCMSINSIPEFLRFADFADLKNDLIKYKKQGYDSLGFLGGEVTLYPKLVDLVNLAKELGFKEIHLITNGRNLKDMAYTQSLVENGITRFSLSIHSHCAHVEDDLTQVPGGFKEKIQGLKNLLELSNQGIIKKEICLNLVVNKKNYQDLVKTFSFFSKLGVKNFRFNFMWPRGNASQYFKELLLSYKDFLPYLKKLINLAKVLRVHLVFEGLPFCILKDFDQKEIKNYIGELLDFKTDVSDFNFDKKERYAFNWQERKKNELKEKRAECEKCFYNSICEGVWKEYIKFYGWEEFQPVIK
ncbi:MAG: radical SAM protein [Candidatus Buchananbacteria bacterium]|nr:radical SAM protein [Candidatus Buchananbacteria bacterium]